MIDYMLHSVHSVTLYIYHTHTHTKLKDYKEHHTAPVPPHPKEALLG